MQAIIMSAGRSTRTYPLTSTRPKPLIPIWNRPLLEHQLRQLHGLVDEVLLVVGYRREQIEAQFGHEHTGLRIRYVEQEHQRGTADAVASARRFVTGRTLVLNGDDFYHRDDLDALLNGGRGLLVTEAPDPQNRAVVTIVGDAIENIVEKPSSASSDALCSVGGYCIEQADLHLLDGLSPSPRGELELPDFILAIIRGARVRPQVIRRVWLPLTYAWDVLGTVNYIWKDPLRVELIELSAEDPAELDKRDDIAFGRGVVVEGPIWLGAGVRVGDGARLRGPLVLGNGTEVGRNATLERVVTLQDARVGEGALVRDSVLGAGVRIGRDARLDSRRGNELVVEIQGKQVTPGIDRLGTIAGDGAVVNDGSVVPAGTLLPAATQ
jgi:NDP-sugar pyrophosphorylase family protein